MHQARSFCRSLVGSRLHLQCASTFALWPVGRCCLCLFAFAFAFWFAQCSLQFLAAILPFVHSFVSICAVRCWFLDVAALSATIQLEPFVAFVFVRFSLSCACVSVCVGLVCA